MSSVERRQHPRVVVDIGTVYYDQLEVDGTDALMSDVSLGGCCIQTNRPRPPGTEIDIQIRLPGPGSALRVRGVVRWVRDPLRDAPVGELSGAMGVEFTGIDPAALTRLKVYIEEKALAELFA